MLLLSVDEFYQEIGHRIKTERIKNGLTQDIVAKHLDLTRASIINLEKGRHRPSIHQLLIIAELLQINYTSLVPTEVKSKKTKKELLDNISEAVSDQNKMDEPTRNAVLDFLTSIKK